MKAMYRTLPLLLAFSAVAVAFDLFADDNLIPSDGFHDLLGLTPFWLSKHIPDDLRRTLGTKRDNLPSTVDDLLSQGSGTKSYEIAGNCNLQGTFSSEKVKLEVQVANGCQKPSLQAVFQKLFPDINLQTATQNFILPESFELTKLEIEKSSKEVTVEAAAKGTLEFSDRKMILEEGKLTLGFTAGTPVVGVKQWKIKIVGILKISAHRVTMTIDKPKQEVIFPFTWDIPMVLMKDLMGVFGITISSMNFNEIGFNSAKLDGITFNSPVIKGQLNVDETFQIVAKASVSFSAALREGEVYLVLTRPAASVVKAAIIIDVKDTINIQEVLEEFITQKDFISDFTMLGRIERDCIIMLAKEDIVMVKNDDLMALVSAFITEHDTKQIPKGCNVRVKVPVKANMKNCAGKTPNFSVEVPDILPITIKITAGGLSFKYPDKFKADLPSMLKCIDPQIAAELPSQLFPRPDGPINIKEFTAAAGRYFKLTIVLQGPFEFLGGKIKLADIELTVSKQKNENWKFAGVTTITVGPLAVGITLEKDGGKYTFSAYVESFRLNQLDELIGPTDFTRRLALLGSLKNFGIKDFKLVMDFGSEKNLRVSGTPILWGWEGLSIEGLVWKPDKTKPKNVDQPNTAVAVGFVAEAIRLDKLMEKIVGNKLFSSAWFSELTAVVIISNADGKVESSAETPGKKNSNDIGNHDKIKTPKPAEDSGGDSGDSGGRSFITSVHDQKKPVQEAENIIKRSLKSYRYRHLRRSTIKKTPKSNAFEKTHKMMHPPHSQSLAIRNNQGRNSKFVPQTHLHRKSNRATTPKNKDSGGESESSDGDQAADDDDEEAIKFNIPYLTDQDISKGVTFIGIFNIPQDTGCHGDSMCLWLGETVGRDATIEIKGEIGDGSFKFSATFSGSIVMVPDKLTLQEIQFAVELSGKKSSVKLSCTLYWADRSILGEDQIQFQGAIEVSLTGKLSLEFNMMGMWTKPFDFEYLAFGNLHLAIGISVGVPLPSFEFGAEVWVGKIKKGIRNNDHAIKIAGYFGVNVNDPRDNYVYCNINAFTLRKVFDAFELGSPSVPDFVANTGFPQGIIIAYSTTGKHIEAHDINIAPGLYLKGTINFLGLEVSAEIAADPGKKLLVDIQMTPIDWANGLIALRRSETDKVNGPKAFIYLKPDSITVQINGYISLLGMSRSVEIDVSDTAFRFRMTTELWGIIQSDLEVDAAYGSLAALSFKFKASVSIDFHFQEIFTAVKEFLKKCADAATEAIDAANRRLGDARNSLTNAQNKLTGWQNSMTAYQNKLRKRSAEIERKKAEMQEDCKRKCGKVCVPFLDWNSRCFKVWWWWVGCPTWNHCKWKVDNVICIAGCEISKLANKFVAWAEQTGIKIIIGLTEIGKGLLDVGKGFVGMADKLVEFGQTVLDFAKKAVEAGKQIAEAVTDWLATNLFKLEILELSGSLNSDFNACVGLKVKCVIIGFNIDYSGTICINLNFFKNLAADTVEQKYPGAKKMDKEVEKVNGKFEEFDQDKSDLDKKEKNIDKDVEQETSQRRKRDYVPTAKEYYYQRLAEEPLPQVVTRSAETVSAFKNAAPWVLIKDFDARNFDHLPHQDLNIPAEKRTLNDDLESHTATPCTQIHKVLNKYSMIADGLSALSDSMRNVRHSYQATKRSMQQGVEDIENKVKDTEMKHNMTFEERTDLYHWYNEAKDGLEKWDKRTKNIIDQQHEMSMPVFRSQIEHILMSEKNTNFKGYMHQLHKIGESAFKRSNIPNEGIIASTQELHGIKKDLVELLTKDDSNPLSVRSKVRSIRSNIQGLRRSLERCN